MRKILEAVGIHGYSYPMERAMLASLLTGTPLLMIGKIGEAKTKSAEAIAALLDEPFQKIAADKAQFEDMLGFPNPKTLAEGKIEYAATPISIWNKKFILIDEISRCNPQMQNKFLEVVLERQLMGIQTDVQWVWATMNPIEYAGSQPLDLALSGRMGYVLQVPEGVKADEATLEKIVSSRSHAQTPALAYWGDETRRYDSKYTQDLKDELKGLIYKAYEIFNKLDDHWTPPVAKYIVAFGKSMAAAGMMIDSRRLVMMRNNVIANIAIQTVQDGHSLSMLEIKQLCREVLPLSLPWLASGLKESMDIDKIKKAHEMAAPMLDKGDSLIYRIVTEQDPLQKILLLMEHRSAIDPVTATSLIASLYTNPPRTGEREEVWAEQARRFALQLAFTQIVLRLENIPAEVVAVASREYPIKFDGKIRHQTEKTKSSCKVKVNSYQAMKDVASLYLGLMNSTWPVDWAVAYWAFDGERAVFTPEDLALRVEIARREILTVAQTLYPHLPKTKVSSNGSFNTPLNPHVNLTVTEEEGESAEADLTGLAAGGPPF